MPTTGPALSAMTLTGHRRKSYALSRRAIVLAGQSNPLGQGTASALTDASYADVFAAVNLKQKLAISTSNPLNWTEYATAALQPRSDGTPDMGPELSLGRTLDAAASRYDIVKMAVNSSGLNAHWKKTSTYPTLDSDNLYTQFVTYLDEAAAELSATLSAIVWIQGETDAGSSSAANAYSANLQTFVADLRADLGLPELPFVFNQLHSGCVQSFTATVRTQQAAAAAAITNCSMIDPSDITLAADGLHYRADSCVELGNRLGAAVLALIT